MALKPSLLQFNFDNFAGLPFSRPDQRAWSEEVIDNNGNPWRLLLEPDVNLDADGDSEDPWVGVFLRNEGGTNFHAKGTFILRDMLGKVCHKEFFMTPQLFEASGDNNWGTPKFIKRSEILDKERKILAEGALNVDVYLQIKPEESYLHVPCNPSRTNMLKLFDNDDDADVSFEIGGTVIPAHTLILKMNSPILYEFCQGRQDGMPIQIKDNLDNFRTVLRYVYGGDAPNSVTDTIGKELIIAANLYNVQGLKLAVEAKLVEALMVTSENVAEWLLFANAETCPLLKEHAFRYLIDRASDLVNSGHFEELKESPDLMKELVVEMSKADDSRFDSTEADMAVNELRKSLDEKGLDVDGTKMTLVYRLQESNKVQSSE